MDVESTTWQFIALIRENELGFLAASFAYYTFVSILPLLLLIFLVVSTIAGEELARTVLQQVALTGILTSDGQELVRDALIYPAAHSEASLLGIGLLFWSGLKIFRSLVFAFSQIYDVPFEGSPITSIRNGGIVIVALIISVVIQLAVSLPAAMFRAQLPLFGEIGRLEQFIFLCLMLFPLYYLLPPIAHRVWDALPGTVLTASGWIVLEFGFGVYTQYFSNVSVFGVFGTFIIFILWLYFVGLLILLGACLNVVLSSGHSSSGSSV
ncbi:YihY/virulence factor BrkB family protein [Haladaptatus pallidirubidus]|uniref:YihY family inner membrane protein n=1 Tax=Haladaptatus pallidirubidus TaxID=1008152 RepID=A0AAV3UJW4_9EURY|nr:YihY/virulence factor BrkB family protein [Haladaptatus pallidirubidus]